MSSAKTFPAIGSFDQLGHQLDRAHDAVNGLLERQPKLKSVDPRLADHIYAEWDGSLLSQPIKLRRDEPASKLVPLSTMATSGSSHRPTHV